jgi:hypothetical protein
VFAIVCKHFTTPSAHEIFSPPKKWNNIFKNITNYFLFRKKKGNLTKSRKMSKPLMKLLRNRIR